jgi:hypothetical protein
MTGAPRTEPAAAGAEWLRLPAHLGIEAVQGPCPAELEGPLRVLPNLQATARQVLVRFPGSWALLVEDGTRATVEWPAQDGARATVEPPAQDDGPAWIIDPPAQDDGQATIEPPAQDDGPAWIVDSWAVTLAMLQRGHLCLHASIVRIGGSVVALAGDSGAGKSTTAMALRARGHALLTDDVAIIDLGHDRPMAIPFRRNVHLLPDAAAALGLEFAALPPLAGFPEKSAFLPEEQSADPQPLDWIVILDRTDGPVVEVEVAGPVVEADEADEVVEVVEIEELHGSGRLSAVLVHAGRPHTSPAVLGEQRYFELLARLCEGVRVLHVRRPASAWTLDDVVGAIEAHTRRP